jgi:hypothetical protein
MLKSYVQLYFNGIWENTNTNAYPSMGIKITWILMYCKASCLCLCYLDDFKDHLLKLEYGSSKTLKCWYESEYLQI